MAIGFDEEFDYLEDEENVISEEPSFAPMIKGAKETKADETPKQELVEEVKEEPVKETKPEKEFDNVIFVVKVTTNKEDKALELISDKVRKREIGIYAVARPHGIRGYLFLEAPDREHAEEAVFNLPYVKGIIGKTVTYEEIKQMIEPKASEIKIEKNDVVEIISEPFKNEKAKVVRVDKAKNECVVSLLGAAVPIPVTVKLDNLRVIRREDLDEE
jgi:transcriptional antiterminator NusG